MINKIPNPQIINNKKSKKSILLRRLQLKLKFKALQILKN